MTSLVEALTEKWIEKGKQLDAALARIAELEAAQVDKTSNPQGRLVDNTADLQARVDGLEEALAERTRERDEARRLYQTTYERLKAERDAAIKRAEAAEEDAERLDWLAANPREATVRVGGDMKIAVFWGVSAAPGTTMRAAIDAARAQELQR